MPARAERRVCVLGHNGGPPLDDPPPDANPHVPEWGSGGMGTYFAWRSAVRRAWKSVPRETMLRRLRNAERLGLTYREYSLEIIDRGRYLQAGDVERIAEIIAARGVGQR